MCTVGIPLCKFIQANLCLRIHNKGVPILIAIPSAIKKWSSVIYLHLFMCMYYYAQNYN